MTILVTGATGSVGRMVVDHLLDRGARDVRALTVDPGRAALPAGVEVIRGGPRSPEVLRAALDGVERMYLAPDPATVQRVVAAADAAGVRRIVDLSGEPESWWGTVGAAVESGSAAWTHLWPADFVENVRMWLPQIRATGQVREPSPDVASTPTAMTDIAEVAAVALLADGAEHDGRAYGLTGPEALTRVQMVDAVAAAIGRPVRFVAVTPEESVAALEPTMGDQASFYVHQVLTALADSPPEPNTLVADLTGRPATTFSAWTVAHAGELRAATTP